MDYNLTSARTLLEAFSDQPTSAAVTSIDASTIISTLFKATYLLLMATVGYRAFVWLLNYVQLIRIVNKIDGVPTLPFIGNLHYIKSRKEWLNQLVYYSNKFTNSPFWRVWIGPTPMIIFHRAKALEALLSDQKVITKSWEYRFLEPWLRTGLITSNGEKWLSRRRLITPAFHFEILDDFLHVMNEQSEILTEKLSKLCRNDEPIEISRVIQMCTLDVILETAMGQNVNAQNDSDSEYVRSISKMCEIILARMVNPLLWPDFLFRWTPYHREQEHCIRVLHKFTRDVIEQRDADLRSNGYVMSQRRSFLDIMLEVRQNDPSITFEDIQEEVDTFMFAGNDSTAAAASWACHFIGANPDVQKKLHEEVDRVFGDTSRALTKEDLKKLEYLECVIKETLRMVPSVPFFGRLITDDIQIENYKLLKGQTAMVTIYALHRDEKYFPDPERFDPDRFLPENCKDRHPFAYIPFAAGRRNCIGQRFVQMEEKVVLANLLRKFELRSNNTLAELNPIPEIVTRPFKGIPIELKLRN